MTVPNRIATRGGWTPILTGDDATEAMSAIHDIARDLADITCPFGSLAGGSAGVALFFGYLARIDATGEWSAVASRFLKHAAQSPVEAGRLRHSFMWGITGVAWAIAHLNSPTFLPRSTFSDDALMAELLAHVSQRPWTGVYDHSDGLAGYGLYAMEQHDHKQAATILKHTVDRLAETAVRRKDGITWWTPPQVIPEVVRERYPDGYFNMGLAHGIPSVIMYLARVCHYDIAVPKARALLDEAVRWFLAQRNPPGLTTSFNGLLPVSPPRPLPGGPVVKWCYGDLGVSAALYSTGLAVNEPGWTQEALELARRVAQRPVDQTLNAFVCHGAAGNGHIFNRLFQASQEMSFLDAAQRWFRQALHLRNPGHGIGGFTQDGDENANVGLFGGPAGVGLALISAITPCESAWDSLMMVSTPPFNQ